MANYIGPNDAITQRIWRPGITHEVERQTFGFSFVGKDEDSPFMLLDDLTKNRGDLVQVKFSPTGDSDGLGVGDEVFSRGQEIVYYNDELRINYLGQSWRVDSPMNQQRTNFSLKQTAFNKAAVWWRRRFETAIWNQMAGYTPANTQGRVTYEYTGSNAVTAHDAAHIHRPNSRSNDQTLAAGDELTLDLINDMVLRAQSKSYLTYPIAPDVEGYYHLVIHPINWHQLRTNSTSGEWEDIQLSRIKGGEKYEDTAINRSHLGTYNSVKIHVSDYTPNGVSSADGSSVSAVRRCIFFGQKAGCIAFGEGYANDGHLDWSESVQDHKKWSLLVDSVWGFKRTIFNSQSYGSMVLPVYSPAS